MDAPWTLPDLVTEVTARIAALPAPKNGQVRAVPDERTIRYYVTLGLLDRPCAARGRTLLYGPRHAAQLVAIKRLQALGRSLSEIQALLPTLDDQELSRMSGMSGVATPEKTPRAAFWKGFPNAELRVELAPQVTLLLTDAPITLSPADVLAIREAARPLLAELATRRLATDPDPGGNE